MSGSIWALLLHDFLCLVNKFFKTSFFTTCSWLVHEFSKTSSRLAHNFFTCLNILDFSGLVQTCWGLAQDLFRTFSLHVEDFSHGLFVTCSELFHDLFIGSLKLIHLFTNISFVQYFFTTYSLFVHDLFMDFSRIVQNRFYYLCITCWAWHSSASACSFYFNHYHEKRMRGKRVGKYWHCQLRRTTFVSVFLLASTNVRTELQPIGIT